MRNEYRAILKLIVATLTISSGNFATADVVDGYVAFASSNGSTSTDIVANADVAFFDAYQNSTVQVTGGDISHLSLHDQSYASISGGQISYVTLHDQSTVRITGIDSLSWLVFDGANTYAEIVANNVQYSNGHLSGNWGNGASFSFWALMNTYVVSSSMPSNILITAVPEADAVWLFAVGLPVLAVSVRRRRRCAG